MLRNQDNEDYYLLIMEGSGLPTDNEHTRKLFRKQYNDHVDLLEREYVVKAMIDNETKQE